MERLMNNQYFLLLSRVLSLRATCARRRVGCVLVNNKSHILSTGYNGTARGTSNCVYDSPCNGMKFASGEGLNVCEAIHAEQNALLQCQDVYGIEKAYVTTEPCMTCTKLLLNTSCNEIIFIDSYPCKSKELWESAGRIWTQCNDDFVGDVHSHILTHMTKTR